MGGCAENVDRKRARGAIAAGSPRATTPLRSNIRQTLRLHSVCLPRHSCLMPESTPLVMPKFEALSSQCLHATSYDVRRQMRDEEGQMEMPNPQSGPS